VQNWFRHIVFIYLMLNIVIFPQHSLMWNGGKWYNMLLHSYNYILGQCSSFGQILVSHTHSFTKSQKSNIKKYWIYIAEVPTNEFSFLCYQPHPIKSFISTNSSNFVFSNITIQNYWSNPPPSGLRVQNSK